jgi:hypothetical protein
VRRWAAAAGRPVGGLLPLPQAWALARRWYGDRLQPGWRRKTPDEAQALFTELGLTGGFWALE